MNNTELLEYFNKELVNIKQHSKSFASVFPENAKHLDIGNIDDPLVNHLIESFAFLTARVQHNLENGHDFILENILNIMYPHYLLPLPSAGVINITPKNTLNKKLIISKHTEIKNNNADHSNYIFRTGYETVVYPIQISAIEYSKELNLLPKGVSAKSCLKVDITTLDPKIKLDNLDLDILRFYLNSSDNSEISQLLYQQIFTNTIYIGLSCKSINKTLLEVPKGNIKNLGFSDTQMLLPHSENSLDGYALLSEYFAYPEKFNFFEISNINNIINLKSENNLTLYFYFNDYSEELESKVNNNTLLLNCVPIINLFTKMAEPIKADINTQDYQVIPDQYISPKEVCTYSVNKLNVNTDKFNHILSCEPFFGRKYNSTDEVIYWQQKRKPCWELGLFDVPGDEVFINLSQESIDQDIYSTLVLTPELLCMNRSINNLIKNSNYKTSFSFTDTNPLIDSITIVGKLSNTIHNKFDKKLYNLVSHISQGRSDFNNSEKLLANIKAIINLYSTNQNRTKKICESLIDLEIQESIQRHPSKIKFGFIHGNKIILKIKEDIFPDQNAFLFGQVISNYLKSISDINSFVSLQIDTEYTTGKYQWNI